MEEGIQAKREILRQMILDGRYSLTEYNRVDSMPEWELNEYIDYEDEEEYEEEYDDDDY